MLNISVIGGSCSAAADSDLISTSCSNFETQSYCVALPGLELVM